jgi:outer membrane protein assembly factor BamB
MQRYAWCLALGLSCATAWGKSPETFDWPQWQGPDRNAVSKEHGLLKEWKQGGPPLAWKIKGLGGGYSGPSIAAGQIFGMSNQGDDEVVWALSETDGKKLWTTPLGPAHEQRMPQGAEGPACTPTVDGERLYVIGMGGDLACLQARDGKILWRRSMTRDFGGSVPAWSYRESPLVDGDKLICTPGGPDATLAALDKLTGKTIWKGAVPKSSAGTPGAGPGSPGSGSGGRGNRGGRGGGFGNSGAAYASLIAIDFDGQREYVQFTSKALVGFTTEGKFLWQYARPANRMSINCSSPVYHDGMVFAASAYDTGGGLVKLSKGAGGSVKAEEVYFTDKMQNHHGGMILLNGCLYGANGGNGGGYLACLDFKTGKVLWDGRDSVEHKPPKGSLALADGRLYYRTEKGTMLLVEPNPKKYVERGRFEQPNRSGSPAWTHPVIANGKLYLRDQDMLLCYDIMAK